MTVKDLVGSPEADFSHRNCHRRLQQEIYDGGTLNVEPPWMEPSAEEQKDPIQLS